MKLYKDPATNRIYAYEDNKSQDHLIKPTYIQLTSEEVAAFIAADDLLVQEAAKRLSGDVV